MKKFNFLTNKMKWLFVPLVLFTIGVGEMWGETGTLVTSLSGISGGDTYYITAYYSSTYYTVPNTTISGQTFTCTAGTVSSSTLTPPTGAGEFVFTAKAGTANAYYIYNTNLSKYLVATGSKTFGYVTSSSDDYGYWTFTDMGSGQLSGQFSVQHSSKTHYMRSYNGAVKCYDGTSNSGIYLFKKDASCSGTELDEPDVTAVPSSNRITLSWPNDANASSYTVTCVNASTGVSAGSIGSITGTTTKSCAITSLTNGTEYTWSVTANGDGSTYCTSDAASDEAIPGTYYTVTFMCNGSTYSTKSIRSGQNLILPDNPSPCMVGKEFVGWATASINGSTNTKPTFVSTQTTISSARTVYAAFATKTANSYSLGDVNDLIEGQKVLIVNQDARYAMANTGDDDGSLDATNVTISSSKISSPESSLIWTVELDGTKYKFKNTYYLYSGGSSYNTNLWCDADDATYPDSWTAEYAGSTGKYYLYSNRSTSAKKVEYWSSTFTTYTAGTGEKFKHSFFVPTYTAYVTSCCTKLGSINGSFKWRKELEDIESPNSFNIYLVYFSMSKINLNRFFKC